MAKTKKASDALINLFTPKSKSSGALPSGDIDSIRTAGRIAYEEQTPLRSAIDAEVAEQMANLPARSKAANEGLGLYHPVGGGIKLSKPTYGMHSTTVPDPAFNPPEIGIITPEQMVKEEAAIIPLVGDRAAGGRYLTHVGENELDDPVRLTAGPLYMDANYNRLNPEESAGWESGAGRVTALSKQAQRAGLGGRPVYGMYTAGSATNTDFNVMGANALIQQIPFSKITKKAEKEFDLAMRNATKNSPAIPDWPGIRSPKAREMLLDKSNGIMRVKLFDTMGKENFQSMGFPDVPATRKAIIQPELLDVPTNQAGFRLARMDTTGRIIENPLIPSDYPVAMAAKVAGQLDVPADYKDVFQTHFANRRLLSQPESGDYYSFSRAHPIQYADDEWLNKLLEQRLAADKKIKTGEYAEGGMVETPAQEAIANTVQNPNAARMLEMDLANLALMNQQPQRMAEGGIIASPEEKLRLFYDKRQKPSAEVVDQADGVYQPPTVESETARLFGMNPKADRLSILPRFSREEGLVAPQFVYEAAKAITAPSVAARGYEVAPEEAVNLAMNVAGAGYGAGAAMRNPTGKGGKDLGMFVGQYSNTWDMDKYELALKMDRAGINPLEINRYTGYYKNPSSKIWSQEISDDAAALAGGMPMTVGESVPISSVLRHDALYKAYPDLKNITVGRKAGAGAQFDNETKTMLMGEDVIDPNTQLSYMIHELQHAIQSKERFPLGGSPDDMKKYVTPEMQRVNKRMEVLNDKDSRTPKEQKELDELFSKMGRLKKQQAQDENAYESYRRLEGEAQARATQARRSMTEQQRRATNPSSSFDVPMSELIQQNPSAGTVRMSPEEMRIEMMESKYGKR